MVISHLLQRTNRFGPGIIVALFVYSFGSLPLAIAENDVLIRSAAAQGEQVFMGRWIRSDGGYFLVFKKGQTKGRLNAAYYNPWPINVARAGFTRDNGVFTIVVELRDLNYPGSTYHLNYDPESDRLIGTYFQAVDKITYRVIFERDE